MTVPSEKAKANRRERDRLKKQRRRARRKEEKRQILASTNFSKTSPAYRNLLPSLPEMTKAELRAMIAQAVRNTQAMVRS